MELTLHPDWKEFLRLLIRHGARFLVIGGHAVAANGRPRFTADLDVFVRPSLANARRIGNAITEFGFVGYGREWRQLAKPDKMMFLGRLPMRIDVLTSISGVSFAEAWRGRIVATTDIGPVPVLGMVELRKNKLASGRAKDLLDLALLDEGATPAASRSRSRPPRRAARPSRTRGKAGRKRRP
jgi:hypothetical protein